MTLILPLIKGHEVNLNVSFCLYLLVNDVSIARKSVTKLLGVVLDDKLLYHKRIDQLVFFLIWYNSVPKW